MLGSLLLGGCSKQPFSLKGGNPNPKVVQNIMDITSGKIKDAKTIRYSVLEALLEMANSKELQMSNSIKPVKGQYSIPVNWEIMQYFHNILEPTEQIITNIHPATLSSQLKDDVICWFAKDYDYLTLQRQFLVDTLAGKKATPLILDHQLPDSCFNYNMDWSTYKMTKANYNPTVLP